MERHEIMELLGQLKLAGMRAAYDEVVAAGVRAQHPFNSRTMACGVVSGC